MQQVSRVLSVVHKLDVIGDKPSDTEIFNKILISLDNFKSPVYTMVTLWSTFLTVNKITSALKQYKANEMGVKQKYGDSALYARGREEETMIMVMRISIGVI